MPITQSIIQITKSAKQKGECESLLLSLAMQIPRGFFWAVWIAGYAASMERLHSRWPEIRTKYLVQPRRAILQSAVLDKCQKM